MEKVTIRVIAPVVLPHRECGVSFNYSIEQAVTPEKAAELVAKYNPPLYEIVAPVKAEPSQASDDFLASLAAAQGDASGSITLEVAEAPAPAKRVKARKGA